MHPIIHIYIYTHTSSVPWIMKVGMRLEAISASPIMTVANDSEKGLHVELVSENQNRVEASLLLLHTYQADLLTRTEMTSLVKLQMITSNLEIVAFANVRNITNTIFTSGF